jgi:DNA-binding protein WhiA
MSFSLDTKNELAHIKPERACCQLAEIAGFVRVGGTIRLAGGGEFELVLSTDNPAVARHYKELLKARSGADAGIMMKRKGFRKAGHTYELHVSDAAKAGRILRDTGAMFSSDGGDCLGDGMDFSLLKTKCCRKACLRGLFLGAGTLSNPDRGYHLEIACGSGLLAADIKRLFNSFAGIRAKAVRRKASHVVYIKDSEQIKDMLNILGAHRQLLIFENVRVLKEMRNLANRQANCDSANLDKTMQAAAKQISAINKINDGPAPDAMPGALGALARLRLANPNASLAELGEMMDPPMNKSGVYRRLKKIEEWAAGRG